MHLRLYSSYIQPNLTEIRTYFTRWLIRMNLYEWPTLNPAPKPTRHWGLEKSYKIVRVRSYEFVQISHLVKYVQIGREIVLVCLKCYEQQLP